MTDTPLKGQKKGKGTKRKLRGRERNKRKRGKRESRGVERKGKRRERERKENKKGKREGKRGKEESSNILEPKLLEFNLLLIIHKCLQFNLVFGAFSAKFVISTFPGAETGFFSAGGTNKF